MLYLDYVWDLNPDTIIPDCELDTKKLGWQAGDYWQIQEIDGKTVFKKVDPMIKFLIEGFKDGHS